MPAIPQLTVQQRAINSLRPWARNARTHSKKQIRQIADSIDTFGFTNPVLIDGRGTILAGHGRVRAAALLGLHEVPCVELDHMSEDQKRAYVLADNKLAEQAQWDKELLALELGELGELDFPVDVIGFEPAEIELILSDHGLDRGGDVDAEDEVGAPATEAQPLTRLGDLWTLGPHRLLCGDARSEGDYARLLDGDRARAVVTDPPYNVRINGHVASRGHHREFAMASGEMSSVAFTDFLRTVFGAMAAVSEPGALHFVFMDWRHLTEALAAGEGAYDELLNLVVWNKVTPGMGSFYRSQHELIMLFRANRGPHLNTVELGRHGRNRSNVWSYRGLAGFGDGRQEALASHPTAKPVAMIADALIDCTRRRDVVLDPFCGSGSTLIAAQKVNRRARLMEIDPHYCDVAVRRWQTFTGQVARHADTGVAFGIDVHRDVEEVAP